MTDIDNEIKERLLRVVERYIKLGFTKEEIRSLLNPDTAKSAFEKLSSEKQVDFLLNSDFFWDRVMKSNGTDYETELADILKRSGTYSEEKFLQAKMLSNRNRIRNGRRPLYPELLENTTIE